MVKLRLEDDELCLSISLRGIAFCLVLCLLSLHIFSVYLLARGVSEAVGFVSKIEARMAVVEREVRKAAYAD